MQAQCQKRYEQRASVSRAIRISSSVVTMQMAIRECELKPDTIDETFEKLIPELCAELEKGVNFSD